MAALRKFEKELHGAQTPVRNLWDRQGSTQLYRPIDENGLSDEITRHLRQELGRSGIFANREVEVKRRPGAPVGQRSDILINTARIGSDRRPRDTLSAVIEVKGCWNPDLLTALDAQLVKDYMVDTGAPVGIYLVGCFDKTHWDAKDNRRARAIDCSQGTRRRLEQQAVAVPEGFEVRVFVLEVRSPGS